MVIDFNFRQWHLFYIFEQAQSVIGQWYVKWIKCNFFSKFFIFFFKYYATPITKKNQWKLKKAWIFKSECVQKNNSVWICELSAIIYFGNQVMFEVSLGSDRYTSDPNYEDANKLIRLKINQCFNGKETKQIILTHNFQFYYLQLCKSIKYFRRSLKSAQFRGSRLCARDPALPEKFHLSCRSALFGFFPNWKRHRI